MKKGSEGRYKRKEAKADRQEVREERRKLRKNKEIHKQKRPYLGKNAVVKK